MARWLKPRILDILELHQEKYTAEEIAAKLEIKVASLRNTLRDYGIVFREEVFGPRPPRKKRAKKEDVTGHVDIEEYIEEIRAAAVHLAKAATEPERVIFKPIEGKATLVTGPSSAAEDQRVLDEASGDPFEIPDALKRAPNPGQGVHGVDSDASLSGVLGEASAGSPSAESPASGDEPEDRG